MRHLLILCPPLKVNLPAFEADLFLPVLPAAQAGQGNAGMTAEGLSSHPQLLPVSPDSLGLSIEKELVVLIQKVGNPGNHPPLGAFGGSDFRVPLNKRTGDRIAFSTHRAA